MPSSFRESDVEQAALAWLEGLGYALAYGPDIAVGQPAAERSDPGYRDVVFERRLRQALERLNPGLERAAIDEAMRKLVTVDGASLLERNRAAHRLMVDGVAVEYLRGDGVPVADLVRVIDFEDPRQNDWLAVSQLTVKDLHLRRPDVVLFVNGLPLAVIELKLASKDHEADLRAGYNQLQTYQAQIPSLLVYNAVLAISNGLRARVGALGAGREWFKPWRTITGEEDAPADLTELEVVIYGVLQPRRFLALLRNFLVFDDPGGGPVVKKMAGYHQFHAVEHAVRETLRAAPRPDEIAEPTPGRYGTPARHGGLPGDRRIGVIWHTQGSGKSLTMVFYAGRLVLEPGMGNPTLVVLTDRNDLDDQLFRTFARCSHLLRQRPVQAKDRKDLRERLAVAAGGIVFTTIQKFFPETKGDRHPVLSRRRNIVVIADEAHRSQYDFIDGFARHMRDALPNASFVGFTGTPIEHTDANTRAVFGEYIAIYDIHRAVADGATVPIYYESRLAKIELEPAERPRIDPEFEEVTEGEEIERKERLKTKWAQQEALVGSEKRLALIARDLVDHFEQRLAALVGKGMIVCMSRRICVDLYQQIVRLRPDWHGDDDAQGRLKIVMTGSAADEEAWQPHIRSKSRRETLADRFRDPKDPFDLVIVRDMWLTGFDAPSLHTLYVDKPMRGHGLMQAIARVNRVFKDKPGGLVVDHLGLAEELKQALVTYSESGGQGRATLDQDEAAAVLQEKVEICRVMLHGFDYRAWADGTPGERLSLLPAAQEHILGLDDGKARWLQTVKELSAAFALASSHDRATALRDEVGFFQMVGAALAGKTNGPSRSDEELDLAIRQIVSKAVIVADGVIDVYAAAGIRKPDISVLSDEFLDEVRRMPRRNLAIELLRKLLAGEIRVRERRNVVQARSFADMLERTVRKLQNRALETAEILEALIALAQDLKRADARGEALGLSDEELAFYDALEANDSAVAVLGEPTLKDIARELVTTVRGNVSIDWTERDAVRARLRVLVKRILRRHGYPPDKQEKATQTVLAQAEVLSEVWAVA